MLFIERSKNVNSIPSGLGGFPLGQNNQIIFEVVPALCLVGTCTTKQGGEGVLLKRNCKIVSFWRHDNAIKT
jgi:hypothetical protein